MENILNLVSYVIGIIGVVIIVWGIVLITIRLFKLEIKRFKKKSIYRGREKLRHQLGEYLLLGLEFLIAADIIGTISHPTLNSIAILGSVVIIRTIISYFLEKEIAEFNPPEDNDEKG